MSKSIYVDKGVLETTLIDTNSIRRNLGNWCVLGISVFNPGEDIYIFRFIDKYFIAYYDAWIRPFYISHKKWN